MKILSNAPLILFVFSLLIPCVQAEEPKKEKDESQGGKIKISPMSLAGKWQLDVKAMLKALKAVEIPEQQRAQIEQLKMTMEFKADGTMVIEVNAVSQKTGKWKLTKAGGSQGKIAFTDDKGKTEEMSVKLINMDSLEMIPPKAPTPFKKFRLTRVKEKKKE